MASGNYARKPLPRVPSEPQTRVPPRATRELLSVAMEEERETGVELARSTVTKALQALQPAEKQAVAPLRSRRIVDAIEPNPLKRYSKTWVTPLIRHKPWLVPLIVCIVCAVIYSGLLISAAILQRPVTPQFVQFPGGKVYSIQVGGNELANTWQTNKPMPAKTPVPIKTGPYSVLGKPTITADFINRVLESYNSPAAGKGKALYDLGVQYGIDPVYALAFFMHESTFGTRGEATKTMSLGNLRCIPTHPCVDQHLGGGYAQMSSWEDGFKTWYELIRNLYVAQWGRVTVDQIIPKYAPNSDNNNEQAYIRSLKQAVDTWRSGRIRV